MGLFYFTSDFLFSFALCSAKKMPIIKKNSGEDIKIDPNENEKGIAKTEIKDAKTMLMGTESIIEPIHIKE